VKNCGICSHTDRPAIDAALIDGASLRAIAGQYGTTKSALDRHRKHIPTALVKAKDASEVADAGTLLSRVEQLVSRCERIYDGAIKEREWAGAVGATRELRGCLELLAKLSGELQTGTRVAITLAAIQNINIGDLTEEQLAALRAKLGKEPGRMTNAEIYAELRAIFGPGFSPDWKALREANLFHEETVPAGPGGNHVCFGGLRDARGLPVDWKPYRKSLAADRFRMLQAAWKKLSGLELSDQVSMQDLGSAATIAIEFDLADPREDWWESWPKVRLTAHTVPEDSPALPAKTLEGVR
jgi:hypothetical protein